MAESLLADLTQLVEKSKGQRNRFESDWYLNVAFYLGEQWVFWNRGRLYQPQLEPYRVTFTDNRILGIVRTEVSKMTKQRPTFVATPTDGDEASIDSAKLTEDVLRHLWRKLDLQRKQRAVLHWSRVCGAGFWKVYWDSSAGDKVSVLVDGQGQPVLDQGEPLRADDPRAEQLLASGQATAKTIAEGDVCVEVRSPFEILVDPLAGEEGLASAEWVIEETVQSMDYCRQRWPQAKLKEDAEAIAGLTESRLNPGMSMDGGSQYKGVRVREFWHKPGAQYPKGKYAVWACDQVLVDTDLPYTGLPYVMFTGIPVPGRFWPTSVVSQLRSVQAEFNKTRSQVRENASRIGNPSLLVSRYANVEYSGIPGEKVEYDADGLPGSVPSYLQPPEMPVYVQNEIGLMENSFREISGQHEVTSGQVPAGITAASAINLLQEQDDTRLGPDIQDMERSLGESGTLLAQLVARFYSDSRTMQIAGPDGNWDIQAFRGTQLGDNTHVEVQAGSAMPQSKAAKMASMEQMLTLFIQNGIPLSQRQLGKYLRDMGVGGYEHLIAQFTDDEEQIAREHRLMGAGVLLSINSYDEDQAHIEGHQNFQKSARYSRLDPRIQQIFEQHVQMHRDRVMAQEQAQQQQEIEHAAILAEVTKPPTTSNSNGSKSSASS
jgi:hypothetical protein